MVLFMICKLQLDKYTGRKDMSCYDKSKNCYYIGFLIYETGKGGEANMGCRQHYDRCEHSYSIINQSVEWSSRGCVAHRDLSNDSSNIHHTLKYRRMLNSLRLEKQQLIMEIKRNVYFLYTVYFGRIYYLYPLCTSRFAVILKCSVKFLVIKHMLTKPRNGVKKSCRSKKMTRENMKKAIKYVRSKKMGVNEASRTYEITSRI
ncbi:hypothetical protein HW555_004308 [Spodoptera exigua]|uniref:HTH psq-type domain-containing protein n=1 Tax=Spodoptera exigua TaxID=7107 RepID=A0A835GJA7_SPOEX|nr:hypothetical protein HW555_004308 [Spodoptera exigua]